MNRMHFALGFVLALAAVVPCVVAQEGPPPPEAEQQRMRPPRQPGDARVELEFQPRLREETMRFDLMRGYIDLVDRIARLSRDPTTAGVAAVISAADLLKARGADAGIEYFTRMLDSAKSDPVKRAIRIQLIELYKQAGQQDKAMEQLTELINAAPAGPGTEQREQQPPPPGR